MNNEKIITEMIDYIGTWKAALFVAFLIIAIISLSKWIMKKKKNKKILQVKGIKKYSDKEIRFWLFIWIFFSILALSFFIWIIINYEQFQNLYFKK